MNFNQKTAVKDIATGNSAAAQILEKAGVDYCCGGHRSLEDACAESGVSAKELLQRLRETARQSSPEDTQWSTAPLSELTEHIRRKHHAYVREAIPRISALLTKVKAKHGANHSEIAVIGSVFAELGQEMMAHMQKEEIILFPYIERLEWSKSDGVRAERPFFQTVRNPIQMMMKEHDGAGDLTKQIRRASSGYAPPADACTSYKRLYSELADFEADLHQHVHLENNILFPRAIELENAAG